MDKASAWHLLPRSLAKVFFYQSWLRPIVTLGQSDSPLLALSLPQVHIGLKDQPNLL